MPNAERAQWKIEECAVYFDRLHLRGWCHHPTQAIAYLEVLLNNTLPYPLVSLGVASPDVEADLGPRAAHARFDEWLVAPPALLGKNFSLRIWLADGTSQLGEDALTNAAHGDAYFQSWENFIARLEQFSGGAVLELGEAEYMVRASDSTNFAAGSSASGTPF